jgi:hypothetical protein
MAEERQLNFALIAPLRDSKVITSFLSFVSNLIFWHDEGPIVSPETVKNDVVMKGEIRFRESRDDEWWVVALLSFLSSHLEDIVISYAVSIIQPPIDVDDLTFGRCNVTWCNVIQNQ